MKSSDVGALIALAAVWGASFLFLRVAVPDFGPVAVIALRVGIAAVFLAPFLVWRGDPLALAARWRPLLIVGVMNSALPFLLYAWAMLSVTAGFAAITNATAPLFTALIAWIWLRDRLSRGGLVGLLVGFFGVVVLVWPKLGDGSPAQLLAVAACLGATLCYGWSASYTKRALVGLAPITIAAGSQVFAALALIPFAVSAWPSQSPGAWAWGAAVALGVLCTGVAYMLYFRLLANVGPARTVAVTYLIPPFGMVWGWLLLGEQVTASMLLACGVILLGTGLASGVIGRRRVESGPSSGLKDEAGRPEPANR
ncbi:MAG: DMT family transporter [Rhodocyclaceae bacterium]